MKVLIINGSHRAGNTDILTNSLKDEFKKNNVETRELVLREIEMKLPDGCEGCGNSEVCPNVKDQFSEEIEPTIRDYDIYIVATPTWDDGITPLTKIFWDRIVSWCHPDKMYLKGKKLTIATHGMADEKSWKLPIDWIRSVCVWEEAIFVGSLTFKSDVKAGSIKIDNNKIEEFVVGLINK